MRDGRGTAGVLGIDVPDSLLDQWRGWYAPAVQPFPIERLDDGERALLPQRMLRPTPEVRDTFFLYRGPWAWLDEGEFRALPSGLRRRLLSARRQAMRPKPSPVWPSELAEAGDAPLWRWVEAGTPRSRHRDVTDQVWERCGQSLPHARALGGTFPAGGSGANCFATVLAAAGDTAAAERWVQGDEFGAWLRARTAPINSPASDGDPGTVLVWREHGALAHAAVTIGGGWALVKPSQAWCSPRLVQPTRELILCWRHPGTRMERHGLVERTRAE